MFEQNLMPIHPTVVEIVLPVPLWLTDRHCRLLSYATSIANSKRPTQCDLKCLFQSPTVLGKDLVPEPPNEVEKL